MVQHVAVSLRAGNGSFRASDKAGLVYARPEALPVSRANGQSARPAKQSAQSRPSQRPREQPGYASLGQPYLTLHQQAKARAGQDARRITSHTLLSDAHLGQRNELLQKMVGHAEGRRPQSSPSRRDRKEAGICRAYSVPDHESLNAAATTGWPNSARSGSDPVLHQPERKQYAATACTPVATVVQATPDHDASTRLQVHRLPTRPATAQLPRGPRVVNSTNISRPQSGGGRDRNPPPSARTTTAYVQMLEPPKQAARPQTVNAARDLATRPRLLPSNAAPSSVFVHPESDSSSLYRKERVIGKGAFGSVTLVSSVLTGQLAAMKTIDRTKLYTPNLKKTVEHEIKILKRLRHDGVVRLLEVIERPRSIHLVLEYAPGGNLQQLVKARKRIDEAHARSYLWQILDSVEYCHSHRVCHRDLKLENFVLDRSFRTVKLIDFGLSVIWRPDQALFKSYGTPCYSAPEILSGQSYQGPQVDVWSLGVSLYTMLTGTLPFQAMSASELKRRVMSGRLTLPDGLSAEVRDLIRQMLTLSPEQRIDIPSIRRHPWLLPVAAAPPHATAARPVRAPSNLEALQPEDEPIDPETLRKLAALGLNSDAVVDSVRTQAFNHEAACYQMLRNATMPPPAAGLLTETF
mmetsp:Transcript_6606/g.14413  ORF Transcript_6606/g.14413 Transcript_6606/m.14413 type:complete len:635 (-) Transcript_6606:330-2234(-)